MTIKLDRC